MTGVAAGAGQGGPSHACDPDDPPWGVTTAALMLALFYYMPWLLYETARGYFRLTGSRPSQTFATVFSLSHLLVSHLIVLGVCWVVVTRAGRRPFFGTLGWGWPRHFELKKHHSDESYSARRVTVLACFALAGLSKQPVIFFPGAETEFEKALFSTVPDTVVTTLAAVTTAPLVEELLFRGLLYPALRRLLRRHRLGRQGVGTALLRKFAREGVSIATLAAVLAVTVLFTAVHVRQYGSPEGLNGGMVASVVLGGLFFTSLRAYTKSLLPSYVMHLIVNASNIPLQVLLTLGVVPRR